MDKHNLLHPPVDVKNLKKNDEVLYIKEMKNGKFCYAFLNIHFKELHNYMDVAVKDLSNFLDSPACRNLKAVIFLVLDKNYGCQIINIEIRQLVYEEVRKRKWPIYLAHPQTFSSMLMLFASKIDLKPGDVILKVSSMGPMIDIIELQRKQDGYSFIGDRRINRFNRNINDVITECLGTCDPKYVIVWDLENIGLFNSLKSRFGPSKNVINIDTKATAGYYSQAMKTTIHRGYNHIIPYTMDKLAVTNESNFTAPEQALIIVDDFEELPLEKIKIVPKSKNPYYVEYLDENSRTYKPACKAQISKEQEGHRIKLALVVDRNSLPFLYQDPFNIPEIQALPQKLAASKADLNIPFIGFFDNSFVICVRDENGYKFLNEWNGLYGNDLYLSFEPEEPIVTDLNKFRNKDPFVVYDLIKILSLPANNFNADPNWGFKVTRDAENPVLLEIETFFGIRIVATPVFLMALLLKHHIKAIKKETGKKPKELGFSLFNQFTKKEKKRIKTGLEEACKLLNIDYVTVSNV